MVTLKLKANPTFHEKVGIPVHGGDSVDVDFEFKHRTRTEFAAFCKALDEKMAGANTADEIVDADVWYVMQTVVAWGLTDTFTADNVRELLQNYQGAAGAIASTYTQSLMQVKLGNSGERRARSTPKNPTPLN